MLAIAKPTASIGLEISGSVMISEDYELWSQRLATIRIPAPVPVPFPPYVVIVPIPVSPTLKIIIEGDVEASAALGVGAEIYVRATAGAHYKDGELNPTFKADFDPMYRVSSGVDFDLSWNAEVRARGELHFNLLRAAGPYVGVVPYYGISSGCGDSLAETYMGWRLEVGGDLTAIGGPRLELPAYDSSPISQGPVSLSRMPSGDSRCQEMPEPDPDPEPEPDPDPEPNPQAICVQGEATNYVRLRFIPCYNPNYDGGEQLYRRSGECRTLLAEFSELIPLCPTFGGGDNPSCGLTESEAALGVTLVACDLAP